MVYWLPAGLQQIVIYSPLVNIIEMFRAGYFGPNVPTTWDVPFILLCTIAVNAIGWILVLKAQRHIELE